MINFIVIENYRDIFNCYEIQDMLFVINSECTTEEFVVNENRSLIIRLIIYIVCVSTCLILLLKAQSTLALLLCLLLIVTRAGLVALVMDRKRDRGGAPSQKKP